MQKSSYIYINSITQDYITQILNPFYLHRKSLGPCCGPERSLNLQFENIREFEVKFETNLGYKSEGPDRFFWWKNMARDRCYISKYITDKKTLN